MPMRVCALLMPASVEVGMVLAMTADLRAAALVHRPEWQDLTDIEIIEQVLSRLQDPQVQEAINKKSTTTKVGSLIEEK